jgi:uncharacterized protein YbjT (DUF2867 family)
MIVDGGFKPQLRADLLRLDIEPGAVIWSPIRSSPAALDPLARVMVDVLDGRGTIDDIVADVHEVVGISVELAETQVRRILHLLDGAGALTTSQARSAPERQRELFINPPST